MTSELINAHIALGEPCGEEAELSVIADWAGHMLTSGDGWMTKGQITALKDIHEYLLIEELNNGAREYALERYYKLYDSITGRNNDGD